MRKLENSYLKYTFLCLIKILAIFSYHCLKMLNSQKILLEQWLSSYMPLCGKKVSLTLEARNQKLIWPINIFVFSGLNLTPEANEAGAAFTPKLNAFANNLTRWDLTVEELQLGGGYPGSVGCNNVIPHAKWHAQTSAALSDMMRLMDFVLKLEKQYM